MATMPRPRSRPRLLPRAPPSRLDTCAALAVDPFVGVGGRRRRARRVRVAPRPGASNLKPGWRRLVVGWSPMRSPGTIGPLFARYGASRLLLAGVHLHAYLLRSGL